MKLAIVGVTGLVGRKMLEVLNEFNFPVDELIPVASSRSAGKTISFRGQKYIVVEPDQAVSLKPDIAIFSAGGKVSKEWAPKFAEVGCRVIDNSSAWRMDPTKKLVVPEVNANVLERTDMIIANPNCSTIQMVVVLAPLHLQYKIKRLVVSTYQSVTGTGKEAVDQMEAERRGDKEVPMVYPHPIDKNCIPHCDVFMENGYTKEEMKLVNETRKILSDQEIGITATAVRIPLTGGHGESINVTFEKDFDLEDVRKLLDRTEGVIVYDDPFNAIYPMPLISADRNEVFVGRIRRDESWPNTMNMWIVADNLRKGAATNAVQIADYVRNEFM
jgi:aspartate-semialdehyde dehydrogenase